MTLVEQVNEKVRDLPEEAVAEVLAFVKYLRMKLGKNESVSWDAKVFVKKFAGKIPDFSDIEGEGPNQERDWMK